MSGFGCLRQRRQDDIRSHHFVVLMVQDVAVPDLPWSNTRIEGIRWASVDRRPPDPYDCHLAGVHLNRVFPPLFDRTRRTGLSLEISSVRELFGRVHIGRFAI